MARYVVKKRTKEDIAKSKNRNSNPSQIGYGIWDQVNKHFVINFEFRSESQCKKAVGPLNARDKEMHPGRKFIEGKGSDFK